MVTMFHHLSPADRAIVGGILDMYESAWVDGIPDIDHYVSGVTPDVLPTLLFELVQCEDTAAMARGLFPQAIHCATTPELQEAVRSGRSCAEMTAKLRATNA